MNIGHNIYLSIQYIYIYIIQFFWGWCLLLQVAASGGDSFLIATPSWRETQMCEEAKQYETQPVPPTQGAPPLEEDDEDENVRLADIKHIFSECAPWQQDRRLCEEIDANADAQQPMELDEMRQTVPLPHYDALLGAAMPSVPLVGEVPPRTPALPPCTGGPDTQEEALQMQAGRLPAECSLEAFGRFFVGRLPAREQNAVF